MTELVTESTRILDQLNFNATCERVWAGPDGSPEPLSCGNDAVWLVTFRNLCEVVVCRLSCEGCLRVLEGQGRVFEVRAI